MFTFSAGYNFKCTGTYNIVHDPILIGCRPATAHMLDLFAQTLRVRCKIMWNSTQDLGVICDTLIAYC